MSEEVAYGLVVAFPDGSESFVNGFAAGQIWESMTRGDVLIERTVLCVNEEVIRRMAVAKGYIMDWRETSVSEWADVILSLDNRAPPIKPNPIGLQSIQGGKS